MKGGTRRRHARAISFESPGITDAAATSRILTLVFTDLANSTALKGDRSKATEVLNHLREQTRDTFVSAAFLATVQVGLGQVDEAFAALEEAAAQHSYYAAWWKLDPELDQLHSDPRFAALLKKVRLEP